MDVFTKSRVPAGELLIVQSSTARSSLEDLAVRELQRFAHALFGMKGDCAEFGCEADGAAKNGLRFLMGVQGSEPKISDLLSRCGEKALAEQEYLIRSVEWNETEALMLAGGSPAALLWAVYELAEFWGVRFLLDGEVLPAQQPELTIPGSPLRRRPLLDLRSWRGINRLPHSGAYWGIADYRKLIDQLAKMRFNSFHVGIWPHGPFADYEWGGRRKQTAELSFGWRFPIDEQTVGRDKFSDALWYENPDVPYEGSYEQKITAGKKLLDGICEHARARGMSFGVRISFTQFPHEFSERLRELSVMDGFVPANDKSGYVYRLGISREGMDPSYSPFMSIRNGRFIDLVESQLRAYLEACKDSDFFVLSPPEFANSSADADFAWKILSQKYDLPASDAPERIIERVKRELESDPNPISSKRVKQQVRGHICTLQLLDELLNERGVFAEYRASGSRLVIGLAFPAVASITHRVLDSDIELMTTLGSGYLASDAARHADQLEQVCGQARANGIHLTVTIEDDNIGVTPQFHAPSLAKTVRAMHQNGVSGLWGRQWLLSKLDPTVFYLSHACWDETLTPDQAYRSLVEKVCGAQAVEPLLEAFHLAEQITVENENSANIHSFLTPALLANHWEYPDSLKKTMLAMRPKYNRLVKSLQKASSVSTAEGRSFVDQFIGQASFAEKWITVLEKTSHAALAYQEAQQAKEAHDVDRMDRQLQLSLALLDEAIGLSSSALQSWSQAVRDQADLGVLAALNHYGHRYLLARRHIQYLRADHWALASPDDASVADGAI